MHDIHSKLAKGLWCNISFIDSPMPYMGMAALIVGFLMDKQHSCGCQHSVVVSNYQGLTPS